MSKHLSKYRIVKEWSDHDADYYYNLQIFQRKLQRGHECYSCYDDWSFRKHKCHNNVDRWENVANGDKKWAKRVAKYYELGTEDVEL